MRARLAARKARELTGASRRSTARRCRASSPTARSATRVGRALHRRGRLCWWSRRPTDRTYQAICRSREDHQQREEPHQQGAPNNEIQAMITAIGTGIGDESDSVAALRPHHRHDRRRRRRLALRTLILTFLYRHMRAFRARARVHRGAALYKVKLGNQEYYFEKELQLEDLLVRERFDDLDARPRRQRREAHRGELKRFTGLLGEFEGWFARFRSNFGHHAADLVIATPARRAPRVHAGRVPPGALDIAVERLHALRSLVRRQRCKGQGRRGRRRRPHRPSAHRRSAPSPIYAHLRKSYAKLVEVAGVAAVHARARQEDRRGATFSDLRSGALDLAKEVGIELSRFKGLGEINSEQLWETTMILRSA